MISFLALTLMSLPSSVKIAATPHQRPNLTINLCCEKASNRSALKGLVVNIRIRNSSRHPVSLIRPYSWANQIAILETLDGDVVPYTAYGKELFSGAIDTPHDRDHIDIIQIGPGEEYRYHIALNISKCFNATSGDYKLRVRYLEVLEGYEVDIVSDPYRVTLPEAGALR